MSDDDRLLAFRAALQRLDPMRPLVGPERDLYVERPEGLSTRLGRHLQIDPTGAHLVVGPIGCGKTTEMVAAGRIVTKTAGCTASYVDISSRQDLEAADELSVLVVAAESAASVLHAAYPTDPKVKDTRDALLRMAHGYFARYGEGDEPFEDSHEMVWRAGVVRGPASSLPQNLADCARLLVNLRKDVARLQGGQLVLLLDGLDRIHDPGRFDGIAEPVVRILRHAQIGVVIVGPWRMSTGIDRVGAAIFDEIYEVAPVQARSLASDFNLQSLAAARLQVTFLMTILARRDPDNLLAARARAAIVETCGGVLRDMLQLAKTAVQEAWARGCDVAGPEEVAIAADRMGRSLAIGLTTDEIQLLARVADTGEFVPTSDTQRALIPTTRILEYRLPSGLPTYRVHPTLLPLLAALKGGQ